MKINIELTEWEIKAYREQLRVAAKAREEKRIEENRERKKQKKLEARKGFGKRFF